MNGLSNRAGVIMAIIHAHPARGLADAPQPANQKHGHQWSNPHSARLYYILPSVLSFIAMGLLALFLGAAPADAQPTIYTLDDPHKITRIMIAQNKSTTIRFSRVYKDVLVGNDKIADIVPLTNKSLYVLGKAIGMTRLVILDEEKELLGVVEVEVSYDVTELNRQLRLLVSNAQIKASSVNGKIMLTGLTQDAPSVTKAVAIARQFAPEGAVTNAIGVNTSQQVLLEVRFIEVSRNANRDVGVNWSLLSKKLGSKAVTGDSRLSSSAGVGGVIDSVVFPFATAATLSGSIPFGTLLQRVLRKPGITADVVVQALEERGLARRLAEPNLVALSGDTASFLAGGEFPIPVPGENNSVTVEFKKFGVGLAFTPTVLANGMINLKIEPEVSEIDPTTTVTIQGLIIPGLVVRRASTTLELRDGQSFAMAGLLQFNNRKIHRQLPWIGKIPVLGALFRSASYQKNESDLVIMVTPHLVKPAVPGERLISPLEKSVPANDLDFFLLGKHELWKTRVRRADIEAGHNIEFGDNEVANKGGGRGLFKK